MARAMQVVVTLPEIGFNFNHILRQRSHRGDETALACMSGSQ